MMRHLAPLAFAVALAAAAPAIPAAAATMPPPTAAACPAGDGLGFVCGVAAVEDLAPVDGGRFLIGSSYKQGGAGLYRIDTARRIGTPLALDIAAARDPRYAACDAPDLGRLMTHGLDVVPDERGGAIAYVVNHGGREAVEVFRVAAAAGHASWIGCVPLPKGASGNAVAALPDGRLAITRFHDTGDDMAALSRILAGRPTGLVYLWTPGRGFRTLPGAPFAGPNGVAASADGRWLFVNDYGGKRIWRLPLGQAGTPRSVRVPFHPDNLRRTRDGALLVAGQIVRPGRLAELHDWAAIRLDPRTIRVAPIARHRALPAFDSATTAVEAGGRLWFGSFRGDRVAFLPAPAPAR